MGEEEGLMQPITCPSWLISIQLLSHLFIPYVFIELSLCVRPSAKYKGKRTVVSQEQT